MHIILDDNGLHHALAPLTLTRPVGDLRVGIDTIADTWLHLLSNYIEVESVTFSTASYLEEKFKPSQHEGLILAGNIKPTEEIAELVSQLHQGDQLFINGTWVASFGIETSARIEKSLTPEDLIDIIAPWHIFQKNGQCIKMDFARITKGRTTQQLSATNQVIGSGEVFLEKGAKVECAILNTENGPIYIGKNAEVMEGSIIRGPFALGENSVVKMGAKMYGDSTIGPSCKVGGEVSNSVFHSYSNKGHDGFVGNSVVGQWCNFGADTNTSNLKNNYSKVRFHSYETSGMEETGVMFCGVIMGDHSKTAVNTMLNTATSVGVCANIFGGGFPPKFIPSYSWGAINSNELFKLDKAYEAAQNMMKRRSIELTNADKNIMAYLFEHLA